MKRATPIIEIRSTPLLDKEDPDPVSAVRLGADAPWLIICDHAGRDVPLSLARLGLPDHEFDRHIAWDIGAAALSRRLGEAWNAAVIAQTYSRLVIDCNRDPARADSIPEISDGTTIPMNAALSPQDRQVRIDAIHTPYHAAIAREIAARTARGLTTALLLVHSFTPSMNGVARPWRFGVLHDRRSHLSRAALEALRREGEIVGDNEPYAMDDIDYTAPRHAIAAGHAYLELEVRQDLLADEAGQARVADLLARVLPPCLAQPPE